MLAELHRKVPESVFGSEDVLTSYVFGVLETLHPEDLLLPWLRKATRLDGSSLAIPPCSLALFRFWPTLRSRAITRDVEPDVIITLRDNSGVVTLILVEAKFRSGPSGWPTGPECSEVTGQLGREWIALSELPSWESPGNPVKVRRRILLYATADSGRPAAVMQQMVDDFAKTGIDATSFRENLYWLSWRELSLVIDKGHCDRTFVLRLQELLEHRHLRVFGGCQCPVETSSGPWLYRSSETYSLDAPRIETLSWSYEQRKT